MNQLDPTYNWELMRKERFLELPRGFLKHILANKISIDLIHTHTKAVTNRGRQTVTTICSNSFGFPTCFIPPVLGISKVCRGSPCSGAIYCSFSSEVISRQFSSPSSLTILMSGIYRVGVSSGDHQEAGVTDKLSAFLHCRARKNSCNILGLVISDLSPLISS